jgi:hypothetical protein
LRVARVGVVEIDLASGRDEDHADDDKCRYGEADGREHDLEGAHRVLTVAVQNAPAARMEGTQRPTKMPSSRLSVNHSAIESRKELAAATRNSVAPERCLFMGFNLPEDVA